LLRHDHRCCRRKNGAGQHEAASIEAWCHATNRFSNPSVTGSVDNWL
jgi:hypothetical protein